MVASLYFSFTHYDLLSSPRWIGLANYKYMVQNDPFFWQAVRNTAWMVVIGLPLRLFWALLTATLLTQRVSGQRFYRTLYYLPTMVPPVAAALAFTYLLNPDLGPVNGLLAHVGIGGPLWFFDPSWSKPALVLLSLWGAGDAMIVYLAGLLDVPKTQIEAARIDGANALRRYWHVTLPSISPGDLLHARHRADLDVPDVHRGLRRRQHDLRPEGHARRAAGLAALLRDLALPAGLPLLQHGLRLSHGLGAVRGHDAVHARADQELRALGARRGQPVNAIAARQRARRQRLLQGVARHAVLIGVGIVFVSPFVFVIFTALMTRDQALTRAIWPHPFRFHNFYDVLSQQPLLRWTWNTFLVSFLSSVGVVLSCAPPAYALARMRFRGRNAVFLLVLSTMMLPIQVTIIPLYVLFSHLGWIGSLKPLIIPGFFGDAFSIFLLRQFFMTIPSALTDAARVDGASELRLLLRVVVPLAKPALVAVFLFNFLYCWNDLFAPLLYVGADPGSYTVSLGLSEFRSSRHVDYELMMAACVLFTLPVTLLFFLAQRAFVEGVTVTGVKG